ncbi:MAG TPA: RNB domain-containing ribonuclease [Usitatibacteraceae bacterium]|nr:RNB domain-containing ribonuclease [Usitatibacteraceae bacterium]
MGAGVRRRGTAEGSVVKQVFFEEDGAFRVGTILAEAGAAFQVEAAHGKRSKVKASAVLLRFDGQVLTSFMPEAQVRAGEIDPKFLWEVCGPAEFGFADLARDYYGHVPAPLEAGAVALALHANPMYFYRRGKGRYQAAPEENLRAALAGLEKKRRQQEQVDAWAEVLGEGAAPPEIAANLDALLFKPDKLSLEWRALDQAASRAGLAPPKLLAKIGVLAGPEDYFLRRFAFEWFPSGPGFPATPPVSAPPELARAAASAFSIDDHETTEIDDAFSVERRPDGALRVGVHIAAPALFFGRDHALEGLARERLSTVYFPGGKVTMLPEAAIAGATLAQGREVPAASLYLDLDPDTLAVKGIESRLERVAIATNLRIAELETRLHEESLAAGEIPGEHGEDLLLLWRLARKLRAARGAGEEKGERLDYTFRVQEGRVAIEPRRRGTPVDLLVSELMIHLNATWGRMLAEAGIPAIYRNQRGIKTRMEVEPGAHEWLGVTHYAWSSSPLRRFSDLANQRQLAAFLRGQEAPYSREELAAAAREFETAYEAYAEHQRHLERYWCLRWISQEGLGGADATIVRDELVRLEGIPLVCRATGLPPASPGERIRVAFGDPDPWEVHLPCRYAGKPAAG